jgi:protein gp37
MEMAKRLEAMGIEKYVGLSRKTGNRTVWNGVVREDHQALSIPYGWKNPRKIFVNSMSDLFHEGVSDEFILRVWRVMRETPRHNYQILTKRPERMAALVASQMGDVLPNVWLGTSIENSDLVSRVDHLRQAPAAIRFISFEPLIGPVEHEIHDRCVGTCELFPTLRAETVRGAVKAREHLWRERVDRPLWVASG